VTEYIAAFQTITSNLNWDEEALEDKLLEGLKDHVKSALIFFPTKSENLEELFERAQKWIENTGAKSTKIRKSEKDGPEDMNEKHQQGYTRGTDGRFINFSRTISTRPLY
jgi:lysyl-tRNA synthetase class I